MIIRILHLQLVNWASASFINLIWIDMSVRSIMYMYSLYIYLGHQHFYWMRREEQLMPEQAKLLHSRITLQLSRYSTHLYVNMPVQLHVLLHGWKKKWHFSEEKDNVFVLSDPNIDYGYSLELHQWGGSHKHPKFMF